MTIYDYIYQFLITYIFVQSETDVQGYYLDDFTFNIGDVPITTANWLAHVTSIICMCLIVAFAIWLIIWVFKAVAHAFLLRR